MVAFPRVMKAVRCPVTGCPEVAHSAGWLREHFIYRHFFLRVVVVQEGKDPLPLCDFFFVHIAEGRLIKHQKTHQCGRNTQMRWRRRNVAIVIRCVEVSFKLTGGYVAECIEGVETSKYLGRMLD